MDGNRKTDLIFEYSHDFLFGEGDFLRGQMEDGDNISFSTCEFWLKMLKVLKFVIVAAAAHIQAMPSALKYKPLLLNEIYL